MLGQKKVLWFDVGQEKKIIEVSCPEIVHQYNMHMGGVDKNDMLSLYRLNIGTKKWYMHLVYYAVGISVVHAWLIYRRQCEQKEVIKKDILPLRDFQYSIEIALIKEGKQPNGNRGRPSLSTCIEAKPKTSSTVPIPAPEIGHDGVGHPPLFAEKQGRCIFCPKGYTKDFVLTVEN